MKKLVAVKNYLSVALAVAMFTAVGVASASAQAPSHEGSVLPHYFDSSGELKWGAWTAQEAASAAAPTAVHHQALRPTRHLILDAGRSARTRVQ
jgi:hypothetical protein